MLKKPTTSKVNCGSCRLCCHNETVYIMPEYGDTAVGVYKTRAVLNMITKRPGHALEHQPGGACIHLVDGNCEIYDQRPIMCRTFDCGQLYASRDRAERRRIEKGSEHSKGIMRRGREIHLERQK